MPAEIEADFDRQAKPAGAFPPDDRLEEIWNDPNALTEAIPDRTVERR